MCSESIKLSLLVLLLGVGIASVTDLKLNLLGSVLSGLAIATTCVGQIVSHILYLYGYIKVSEISLLQPNFSWQCTISTK
jgi:solute carrier family 35, member E3